MLELIKITPKTRFGRVWATSYRDGVRRKVARRLMHGKTCRLRHDGKGFTADCSKWRGHALPQPCRRRGFCLRAYTRPRRFDGTLPPGTGRFPRRSAVPSGIDQTPKAIA